MILNRLFWCVKMKNEFVKYFIEFFYGLVSVAHFIFHLLPYNKTKKNQNELTLPLPQITSKLPGTYPDGN